MVEAYSQQIASRPRPHDLVTRLGQIAGFSDVVASLKSGHSATLDGVWGSSCALAAAALADHAPRLIVLICAHSGQVDERLDDLAVFTSRPAVSFPAWERSPSEHVVQDEVFGQRLSLLKQLDRGEVPAPLVLTSIQALLQPVPTADLLKAHTRTLRVGETVNLEQLLQWLVAQGFQNMTAVELPGEFSTHGGIVDVFAADWQQPVRLEFFDQELSSIRRFAVEDQRSLERLDAIDITMLDPAARHSGHLADYLPEDCWYLLSEPSEIQEQGQHYLERLDDPANQHSVQETFRRVYERPSITTEGIAASSLETTCHLKVESVERFVGDVAHVRQEVETLGKSEEVLLVCPTQGERERLEEIFRDSPAKASGRLSLHLGRLSGGFRLVPAGTVVLASGELFQRHDIQRSARHRGGRAIDTFLDLRRGDLVVHVSHGIARYHGMQILENDGRAEEHLELEFAAGTRLFVPSAKIDLVQKYVGGTKVRPKLAKIGGKSWIRQKQRVAAAVTDLAADMLELNATRASRPGIAFPEDTAWQLEFDAAFPYEETVDQLSAIRDTKQDMCRPRPMDRLICGDVGYGKTEVAMRTAFKAIDAGYQVGVLVPTTVLAEQHRRTFTARMAEYPFEIASLSRLRTTQQQRQLLELLASGQIDVVIGTHRLVQNDVRFANLGLVIIDEEQRFGVDVKERLKALRKTVDVMTLTATPIPRTLHMSLLGLRDISNLETPPEDRLAVETRVTRFDDELVRHAILRELNRDGQIFFVHNLVYDIKTVAQRIQGLVPEARISIGHGQMPERQLEKVMADFVNHRYDILVATTIVESGLDIPNANTIFIDQADQYGLADLHQLRGRVGRYKHRAYCYLLVDPNKALSPTATKRLRAIEEFSDMGAGFAIAMRDLEIRGAGNILGTQQSGHIGAVGYELYCQLLENAVRGLKNLPPRKSIDVDIDLPGAAYLPRGYVPDQRAKVDIYRRLARMTNEEGLDALAAEMADRFGPAPPEVDRLIQRMRLRIWAQAWAIHTIRLEAPYLVLGYADRQQIQRLSQRLKGRLRVVDHRSAYLPAAKEVADPHLTQQLVESMLRP
jgi:transcription-repair coupling factor (superfamily II helicase)